ncbi:hypothetical protein DMC47_28975 [Nostoc sp. 3335mG]|nr:hypothetical protein DMC47_28975 [Nostoc sp. 3335mG]
MSIALIFATAILQTAPTPVATPADPKARICRKVPTPTGSRVAAKRECRTALEWEAVDAENTRDVDQMRRRTSRQNY